MFNVTWLIKAGKSYIVFGGSAYPSSSEKLYQQKVEDKKIELFIESLLKNDDITTINFQKYPFKNNQQQYVRIGNQIKQGWKEKL